MRKLLIALAAMPLAFCQQPTISLAKEQALDRAVAENTAKRYSILADPSATSYVNVLANRLASHSDLGLPVTVQIVDSQELQAIPLPGGFLFLSTGLILQAQTEAELAGLIAHQIGHMAMSPHGVLLKPDTPIPVRMTPLCARFPGDNLLPVAYAASAQEREAHADALGRRYTEAAGYDSIVTTSEFDELRNRLTSRLPKPRRRVPPSLQQ
ncbi:MAG: M48 family metalloprotease [Bryobacteraceae bacterium]